jgi:hypothetical protein
VDQPVEHRIGDGGITEIGALLGGRLEQSGEAHPRLQLFVVALQYLAVRQHRQEAFETHLIAVRLSALFL